MKSKIRLITKMVNAFDNSSIPVDTPFGPGRLIIKTVRYRAPSGQVLEQKQLIVTVQDEQGRWITFDNTDLASLDDGAILTEENRQEIRECELCHKLVLDWVICPCGSKICVKCTDLIKGPNPEDMPVRICQKCAHPLMYTLKNLLGVE